MDTASTDEDYAQRRGLFKERRIRKVKKGVPEDEDIDIDVESDGMVFIRQRLLSEATESINYERRMSRLESSLSIDSVESLSPIQKMLQREAALTNMDKKEIRELKNKGKAAKEKGEKARRRRSSSGLSHKDRGTSGSDRSSVTLDSGENTLERKEKRSSRSSNASSSSKSKRKSASRRKRSSVSSTGSTGSTISSKSRNSMGKQKNGEGAFSDNESTVSHALRQKRKSLLDRIAKAQGGEATGEGGVRKRTAALTPYSGPAMENDPALMRYLERAVRSIGEQFQFGNMKVTPVDRSMEVGIAMSAAGIGSQTPVTVADLFEKAVATCGSLIAFKVRMPDNKWVGWTYQEYYFDVVKASKALINLGVNPLSSVLMAGDNSPEQAIAHFGAIFAGALPTHLFPIDDDETFVDVAARTKAVVIFVQNRNQLNKFLTDVELLANVEAFVMWGTTPNQTPNSVSQFDIPVYHWEEFLGLGAEVPNADLEVRLDAQQPGTACAISLTPGARGFSNPKLVLLTHDNLTWSAFASAQGMVDNVSWGKTVGGERTISLETFANTASLVLDLYVPLILAGVFNTGQIVHFVPLSHGSSIVESLRAVRPTAFHATPHTYDQINDMLLHGNSNGQMVDDISDTASVASHRSMASHTSMLSGVTASTFRSIGGASSASVGSAMSKMSSFGKKKNSGGNGSGAGGAFKFDDSASVASNSSPSKAGSKAGSKSGLDRGGSMRMVESWAKKKAIKQQQRSQKDPRKKAGLLHGIAEALVFKNHKDRLGLDHAKLLVCHGGALQSNVLNDFASYGMLVTEAYGMAETSGLVSFSWPTEFRTGSAGSIIDSVELRCINSKTGKRLKSGVEGELVLRGRCVAMGYIDDQGRSDTTISMDGFVRTGDVGSVNQDNYLFLLGRVANRMVLTGTRRYIFPEPIECVLMSKLPMVQHIVVTGHKRKHLTLLITLAQREATEDEEMEMEESIGMSDNGSTAGSLRTSAMLSNNLTARQNRGLQNKTSSVFNTSARAKQRTQAQREKNLAQHAATPRAAHQQLNSQHHNHPQFKQSEYEAGIMLAPRACIDGVRTLGQARLSPAYMGRLQGAIDWYNESELCTNASRKIHGFAILEDVFSAEGERPELAASLFVNRPVVEEKYRSVIKTMYLPGYNSLKQSMYFGVTQASKAGKYNAESGKFDMNQTQKKKKRTGGVKQPVGSSSATDLSDIHRVEVYKTKRGVRKFVTTTVEEGDEES